MGSETTATQDAQVAWQVEGTVEHWGHIHTRRNEYQAEFDVEPRDEEWKITGIRPLSEKRVNFETDLRMATAP